MFKDNAVERARLESEAGASRSAGEAERERVATERARAAEEQAEAVRRLGEGLRTLAAGDLTLRLGTGFSDKYAQIRDDFNEAVDKLKETMLAVVASTRADPVGRPGNFLGLRRPLAAHRAAGGEPRGDRRRARRDHHHGEEFGRGLKHARGGRRLRRSGLQAERAWSSAGPSKR